MATAGRKNQAKRDHSVEDPQPTIPLRQSPRKKVTVSDPDDRRGMDPHDLSDINILATVASLASGLAVSRPRAASMSHGAETGNKEPQIGSGRSDQLLAGRNTGAKDKSQTSNTTSESGASARDGKPPTKRALQSMDKIPLRMLMRLPLKTCVDLFSETLPSRNIYQNKIMVQCAFFVDGSCKEQFECYRDTEQVKKNMQAHIQSHLNYLKAKGQDDFTTNSVQFRQKKNANDAKKVVPTKVGKKKCAKATPEQLTSSDQESQGSTSSSSSKESTKCKPKKAKAVPRPHNPESPPHEQDKENEPAIIIETDAPPSKAKKQAPKRKTSSDDESVAEAETLPTKNKKKAVRRKKTLDEDSDSIPDSPPAVSLLVEVAAPSGKLYPLCDHDYAAHPDAPLVMEVLEVPPEEGESESESISSTEVVGENLGIRHYDSTGAPMVSSEITYSEEEELLKRFLMSGKRDLSEEELLGSAEEFEEDDGVEIIVPPPEKKQRRPALPRNRNEPIPEWERKLALRCIRELKQRKKDEKLAFVCKICNPPRKFTAGATLTYHYRSHAGMKPFKCTIANCPGAFTRMHSLNYHIMIHLNKSRFTCTVCERKFRHPSHFAEHKRKHTGECPFHCEDCNSRFKTRNTYKRHLKTRHGKLLSAAGISDLPPEEAELVKTKPYKKSNSNASSPSHEYFDTELLPGPSKPASPPPRVRVNKKKVAAARAAAANQGKKVPVAVSLTSLPPVSTLLPPHGHPTGSSARNAGATESVVIPSSTHMEGPIHLLPSYSPINPAMVTAGPGLSASTHIVTVAQGLPSSAQLLFMTAHTPMTVSMPGQLVVPSAYYTVAFPVNHAVQHQPQASTSAAVIDEEDSLNYKAVGFVTH